jgi:hypothetical protein
LITTLPAFCLFMFEIFICIKHFKANSSILQPKQIMTIYHIIYRNYGNNCSIQWWRFTLLLFTENGNKNIAILDKESLFNCASHEFISLMSLCDGVIDCIDASDESNCDNAIEGREIITSVTYLNTSMSIVTNFGKLL